MIKREPRPKWRKGGVSGTLRCGRTMLRSLRFANSRGVPKVPHGTAPLLTGHHAQTPAVLDHSRALPQSDGRARPALAGGEEGGERDLIVLDASDVLDNAFAVSGSTYRHGR